MINCNDLIKSLVPNISSKMLEQLYIYYELLNQESKKYNLTTITEYEDVYIKHFYDSLIIGKFIKLEGKSIMDVGTGAGFPGLVLAICYPSLNVTLVEPTTKRCKFLRLVKDSLKLENVIIINERAEKLNKCYRASFDYVTARAVSTLAILLELLTPYAKIGGQVIAFKGSSAMDELNSSQNAISILNLGNLKMYEFELPKELGKRTILTFEKQKQTKDIYPREYIKIKNKPL